MELGAILSKNPEVEQRVREIFDYHLKEGISHTTQRKIWNALETLLGVGAARILMNSCRRVNNNEFFDGIKEKSEGEDMDNVLPFLQYFTAVYGSKMEEAYDLSDEIPEDWRDGGVTLYRKGEEKVWFFDLNLTKYNGASIFLRMPPASAFSLALGFIEEMGKLPREAVDENVIKAFIEGTEDFKKRFCDGDGGD